MQLSFDFTERIIKLNFYTIFDMLSKVGGFKAAIGPIIAAIAPFFILYFLIKLSKILKGKMMDAYKAEVRLFVKLCKDQFSKLQYSVFYGDLKFHDLIQQKIQIVSSELKLVDD